jgi:hypothetical protein
MNINDLSDTIEANSDRLNAADLMGADKTIKVTDVIRYTENGKNKFYLNYEGDCGRPYKPSLTMRRIIMELWTIDGSKYIGRSIRLHRDPTITFGRDECGGIVVEAMEGIKGKAKIKLQVKRGQFKEFTIDKLEPKELPMLEPGVFAKWLTAAKTQIESGAQTNEQIITKIEVQSRLTDEQKEQIRAIGSEDLTIDEGEFLADE